MFLIKIFFFSNIFFQNDRIKLADFGLAYDMNYEKNKSDSNCAYLSPEVLDKSIKTYYFNSDIW